MAEIYAHHDGRRAEPEGDAPAMADRSTWLQWRRQGLGGSDIAAVLGFSPWTSPYALWADKVGLLPVDDDQTEAMEFGSRAEDMLARWFIDRTGLHVGGEQSQRVGAEPWMRCTVDGFVFESRLDGEDDLDEGDELLLGVSGAFALSSAVAVAEWKTTSASAGEWERDGVPDNYACQATWTSIVTGVPTVWFGVLHIAFGRPQFRTYQFTPDEADKHLVLDAARAFWFSHVVTGVPPEIDGSDSTTRAIATIWPEHLEGATCDLTDLAPLLQQRSALKGEIRVAEAAIDEISNVVAARFGDAEIGVIDGVPSHTYRAQTRTTTCEACGHAKTGAPFRVLRNAPKLRAKRAAA